MVVTKSVYPCVTAIHLSLIFRFFKCVWPKALKLGCVTNLDTLFLVMGFISLVDKIQFTLISSCHICMKTNLLLRQTLLMCLHQREQRTLATDSWKSAGLTTHQHHLVQEYVQSPASWTWEWEDWNPQLGSPQASPIVLTSFLCLEGKASEDLLGNRCAVKGWDVWYSIQPSS